MPQYKPKTESNFATVTQQKPTIQNADLTSEVATDAELAQRTGGFLSPKESQQTQFQTS